MCLNFTRLYSNYTEKYLDHEFTKPTFIMLILVKILQKTKLKILIFLVMAIFLVVGTYVGYHVSEQTSADMAEKHDISIKLETQSLDSKLVQMYPNFEFQKNALKTKDLNFGTPPHHDPFK